MKLFWNQLLTCAVVIMSVPDTLYAGHLLDVSISYTHITGSQYLLTARQYRDCSGIPAMDSIPVCMYSNSNAYSTIIYLSKTSTVVLPPSPYVPAGLSSCYSGNSFGVEKVMYSDTITIPFASNDWVFGSGLENILNYIPYQNYFGGTTMDNLNYSGNSSPSFLYDPKFLYCIGIQNWENYLATDPDGDTLLYSIVPMLVDTVSCPNQPYSDASIFILNSMNLIPIYIDPDDGWITFTMNQISYGALTILVEEIRNGQTISQTRQIQYFIHTIQCTVLNTPEDNDLHQISIQYSASEDEVFLQWNEFSDPGTLICVSMDGKEMLRTSVAAGQKSFRISTEHFPAGIYALRYIEQGNTTGQTAPYALRFMKAYK